MYSCSSHYNPREVMLMNWISIGNIRWRRFTGSLHQHEPQSYLLCLVGLTTKIMYNIVKNYCINARYVKIFRRLFDTSESLKPKRCQRGECTIIWEKIHIYPLVEEKITKCWIHVQVEKIFTTIENRFTLFIPMYTGAVKLYSLELTAQYPISHATGKTQSYKANLRKVNPILRKVTIKKTSFNIEDRKVISISILHLRAISSEWPLRETTFFGYMKVNISK